jgi:prepilin signal peptidase PulO-like enzyme (type II secretory pathway)
MSIVHLLNISELRPQVIRWVIAPLFSVVAATSLTRLLHALIPASLTPLGRGSAVILLVAVALLLYALFSVILGAVRREQISWIVSFFMGK